METAQIAPPLLKSAALMIGVAAVVAFGTLTRPAAQASLSPQEQSVLRAIDAGNEAALTLLERVVNINSGTQNFEGVREVGQAFRSELNALGFTTEWVDGSSWRRAGHLVAEHRGAGPRTLLIGHLDTVFERNSPFQKFERIDANTARGPGIIDMKGGAVVMVSALKALHAAGALSALNLIVVMTGDEEAAGSPLSRAREALIAAATGATAAVGFEDGAGDPRYAVTSRRSATRWDLEVKGAAAHSSQIFRENVGFGAVFEAARILNAFRERLAGERHLTFSPGVMLGGTAVEFDSAQGSGMASGKSNVVAGQATVSGDIRALSKEQLEKAQTTMRDIVGAALPGTQATLTFEEGYPPMAPTEGNSRLLAIYNQASLDVGAGPVTAVDPDRAGAADVSFVADRVPMIIDGIGLSGRDGHTANETADLSKLPSQTKRAALLLLRLRSARH
jgi:glutamate carboxypeptidase